MWPLFCGIVQDSTEQQRFHFKTKKTYTLEKLVREGKSSLDEKVRHKSGTARSKHVQQSSARISFDLRFHSRPRAPRVS